MDRVDNCYRVNVCPMCGAGAIRHRGSIRYSSPTEFSSNEVALTRAPELWRCNDCNSSFVQNAIPEREAIRLYSTGSSGQRWSREPFETAKTIEVVNSLKTYMYSGCEVLDIGCNTGELLDFAKEMGCVTSGVEYSETSRSVLKDKGHSAYRNLSDIGNRFDLITAFDLVEHIYNIPDFFAACKKKLKPGGRLVVLTGNIGSFSSLICKEKWWYVSYPEHIVFPSKKFMSQRSGFQLEYWKQTYASIGYQLPWQVTVKGLIVNYIFNRYRGLPSLGPDHILAVLRNSDG